MLEFVEEKAECQIKVGSFSYLDTSQQLVTVEFAINTCLGNQSKQASDYNEQLADEWDRLTAEGFTQIKFVEVIPQPIF